MKINSPLKSYTPAPSAGSTSRVSSAPAARQADGKAAEVSLSPLASLMGRAESALAGTSEINQQRVDEIRQAISAGEFRVDPGRIADGLIASVREMLQSQD